MRFSERNGVVYGLKPADVGSVGADFDCVNMKNYQHATFEIMFGALTGVSLLTINSGATDATKTTAETFRYRLAGAAQAAAGADQYSSTWSSSSSLSLTAATYSNKLLIVEIDAAALTPGQQFVTGNIDATATVMPVAVAIQLSEARHDMNQMPAAIP